MTTTHCGLRKIECVLILVGDRPTETKQSSLYFVYGAYFNAMVSVNQFGWFDEIVFFFVWVISSLLCLCLSSHAISSAQ